MKTDYNKWTKEDLIKRVKWLEQRVVEEPQNDGLQPPPTATEQGLVEPTTVINDQNGDTNGDTNGDMNGNGVPASYVDRPLEKKPKKSKSMDPSKYATRFIALKLAYIGKRYNGFEYQCTGTLSTIEEELWKALVKACLIFPNPEKPNEVDWNVCDYSKCGRTDRGVSAFGQVVALRVRSNKLAKSEPAAPVAADNRETTTTADSPAQDGKGDGTMEDPGKAQEEDDDDAPLPAEQEIQYVRILNRLLPPDIKIYAWAPNPPPGFSARFSCRERQYRYYFTQPAFAPLPNFLDKRKAPSKGATVAKPKDGWLDIEAMRKAAKYFEGLHDFRNFCKIDPSKQMTAFHRRIFEADIVEVDGVDSAIPYLSNPQFHDPKISPSSASSSGDNNSLATSPKVYYFHVRGSAFLWHQIRCMVAILFLVGQGFETPDLIPQLLDAQRHPRRPNYVLADDAPLVLWECLFGRRAEHDENAAAVFAAANDPSDELDWVYIGAAGGADDPLALHGSHGLAGELWALWRERKIDEILANRMLDWLSVKTGMGENREDEESGDGVAKKKQPAAKKRGGGGEAGSNRVYEGGNSARITGAWTPVMKKERMLSFEEMNDRYAVRKGFDNAAEMRAMGNGNWRDALKEAKLKKEALEAVKTMKAAEE